MNLDLSKLTVKDQVVCKYCGKIRAYAGITRHQRSKKCIIAKEAQEVQTAKDELQNLEANYLKDLEQLKASYRKRAIELQKIINATP